MMVPENIKAIAWDLDGTLIDSFGIYSEIVTGLAPSFGLASPTAEVLMANFHGRLQDSIASAFGGLEPDVLESFEQKFLTEQERYYLNIDEHILTDAADLMAKAGRRGLKQVIVTSRGHVGRGRASPRAIVEQSILKPHVHYIICGDETGDFHKPDPAVFGDLLTKWRVMPDELLVIGDQHVDAQLALNVGAAAIIVNRNDESFAHAHMLPGGWQKHITVVSSLNDVIFSD